ncbi:hypothetical protein BDC45DRAFT_511020 [Circinella umbellata]|nr:hypothetical protein BDC45DRAFT_511020 [Circinella umbellata]
MKATWIATAITLLFAYTATSAPVSKECTGVDVLYPKEGTSFSKSGKQTIYVILGNKAHDVRLDKVVLTQGSEEVSEPVWTSMDETEKLSKVMVLQQDLNQVKENTLHDNFTFRIEVEQDGQQCVYESPSFEVTD